MSNLRPEHEKRGTVRVDVPQTLFCEIGEQKDEEIYLYRQKCDQLVDLKIGWKPDEVKSECGFLGELYDLPGRTVFRKYRPSETDAATSDSEWKKLRAPWRHYMAFISLWGPPGNLFYNIRVPLTVISIIIGANAIYATCRETIDPSLPHWFAEGAKSTAYNLTSFLVSLLLGFKINRSFDRWWVARQNFTNICARLSGLLTSITLVKVGNENLSEEQKTKIDRIQRLLLSLPFSMIMTLYSLDRCPLQIRHILDKDDISWMENTQDAWYFLLCKLQVLFSGLTSVKSSDMEKEVNQLRMDVNSMLAIKRTHFPYFLSKIPTALIMVYTVTVPMQLFGDVMHFIRVTEELQGKTLRNVLHYWYLASMLWVLSSLVIAANEAADLLEDPYYYIPIHQIAEYELGKATTLIRLVDPESSIRLCSSPENIDGQQNGKVHDDSINDSLRQTNSWFFKS